jgi:transcriptional regulator with XRE-family HTH domain
MAVERHDDPDKKFDTLLAETWRRQQRGHDEDEPGDLAPIEPDLVRMEFGRRMRLRRELLGLSTAQLARKIPQDPAYSGQLTAVVLASYERCDRAPSLESVWRIARALECSPAQLLPVGEVRSPDASMLQIEAGARAVLEGIEALRASLYGG